MNPPTATLLEAPPVTEPELTKLEPRTPIPRSTPSDGGRPDDDRPNRSRAFARALWTLAKVLILLVLVAAIGFGAAFAWTLLDDRLNADAQTTSAGFGAVDDRLAADAQLIAELQDQVASLTADAEAVPAQLDGLDARLTELADAQAAATARIDDLQGQIDDRTARLDALDDAQQELAASTTAMIGAIDSELDVMRSTELLSRARLYLYQANYGLAIDDVRSARAILATVDPSGDRLTLEQRDATLVRLDLVLRSLPDRPVLAADDLDIAWQLLMGEVPIVPGDAASPVVPPAEAPPADALGDESAPAPGSTGATDADSTKSGSTAGQ